MTVAPPTCGRSSNLWTHFWRSIERQTCCILTQRQRTRPHRAFHIRREPSIRLPLLPHPIEIIQPFQSGTPRIPKSWSLNCNLGTSRHSCIVACLDKSLTGMQRGGSEISILIVLLWVLFYPLTGIRVSLLLLADRTVNSSFCCSPQTSACVFLWGKWSGTFYRGGVCHLHSPRDWPHLGICL